MTTATVIAVLENRQRELEQIEINHDINKMEELDNVMVEEFTKEDTHICEEMEEPPEEFSGIYDFGY